MWALLTKPGADWFEPPLNRPLQCVLRKGGNENALLLFLRGKETMLKRISTGLAAMVFSVTAFAQLDTFIGVDEGAVPGGPTRLGRRWERCRASFRSEKGARHRFRVSSARRDASTVSVRVSGLARPTRHHDPPTNCHGS